LKLTALYKITFSALMTETSIAIQIFFSSVPIMYGIVLPTVFLLWLLQSSIFSILEMYSSSSGFS
jgi:hypothetical protein